MIGGLFFKNDLSGVKQEPKSPRLNADVSGYSIGLQADEGTPDRKPTVLETSGSGHLIRKTRRSEVINSLKKITLQNLAMD